MSLCRCKQNLADACINRLHNISSFLWEKACKRKCDPDNIKYCSLFNFKDIFDYLVQKQVNVLAMKSGSCKPVEKVIDILDSSALFSMGIEVLRRKQRFLWLCCPLFVSWPLVFIAILKIWKDEEVKKVSGTISPSFLFMATAPPGDILQHKNKNVTSLESSLNIYSKGQAINY